MSKRDVRNRVVGKGIIFVFTLSLFLSWLGVTMAFELEVGDSLGYKAFTGFGLIAGLVALIWGTCLGIGLVARSKWARGFLFVAVIAWTYLVHPPFGVFLMGVAAAVFVILRIVHNTSGLKVEEAKEAYRRNREDVVRRYQAGGIDDNDEGINEELFWGGGTLDYNDPYCAHNER